ncbi:MAG: AAA family ATPase, partial [Acidobacteriota bacterium]|nr:AAA family ATPase [Acidobacteriota bacterium]
MKNLTSSIYTFEDLRRGDCLYVDKTEYLWELVSQPKGIYFLSRPRRFGKSLTLSTLKAVFQGKRELFKGLAIDGKDYDWKPHPIIHLDLGDRRNDTPEALDRALRVILGENAQDLGLSLHEQSAPEAFRELIRKAHGIAPVVILIDEYDKPLLDNAGGDRENVNAIREELEAFYGVIKTTESMQRFVFITGVAKFTKVSVFSKLNHLTDITMNGRFATMLGYTQSELEDNFTEYIDDAAQKNGGTRKKLLTQMRRWYNGYRFEEGAETVYNPVSVAQFFQNDGKFKNYWFETGSPGVIFRVAKTAGFDFWDALARPVQDLAFSQFEVGRLQPLPLLVQTGYLTIKKAGAGPRGGVVYYLGFPNYEVESAFETFLLADYLPGFQPDPALDRMFEALSA